MKTVTEQADSLIGVWSLLPKQAKRHRMLYVRLMLIVLAGNCIFKAKPEQPTRFIVLFRATSLTVPPSDEVLCNGDLTR